MMPMRFFLILLPVYLFACNNNAITEKSKPGPYTTVAANPVNDWKFGVALWTFHTFNFQESLGKADSAGIKYIEPNTFQKSGPDAKDSLISQLSDRGIEKLRLQAAQKGLKIESVYIAGDFTILSWKKQFEIARQFGVAYVTAEPPITMWDSIDSLAGLYDVKVAIHEHWKGVSHYWNPDTVLLAIKGHPNFGACADIGHWPKSGVDPLEAIKKLSSHIIGIHLKDIAAFNDPTLKDVPVGTGVINFPAIFEELKKQNFKGHIYIERDAEDVPGNLPSVIQTVTYYNEQVGKLK